MSSGTPGFRPFATGRLSPVVARALQLLGVALYGVAVYGVIDDGVSIAAVVALAVVAVLLVAAPPLDDLFRRA